MDKEDFFDRILIIGLGLVGGSLAKALRLKSFKGDIIGVERDEETRFNAEASGLFNTIYQELGAVSVIPDLIILAVPLGTMSNVLDQLSTIIKPGVLVTDVGSVKGTVHQIVETCACKNKIEFIGGHPMAGSEKGGFSAASPILFENAYYFLTPGENASEENLKKMKYLVESVGAIPVVITTAHHDALVGRLSHLPHLVSSILVNVFSKENSLNDLKYAGGGFRDTTRIAMGNSKLWRDIFIQNREHIIKTIESFIEELTDFRMLLENRDDEKMTEVLERARMTRLELTSKRPAEESSLYPLVLDVEDKPGILADITGLLANANLNIKDIALDHARENKPGALILSFSTAESRLRAAQLIKEKGLCPTTIEQD